MLLIPPQSPAPGQRRKFEQGVAAARIAIDRIGQLGRGQPAEAGDGVLRFAGGLRRAEFVGVELAGQRMVYEAFRRGVAAHNGEIGLCHLLRLELRGEAAADVTIEGEEEYAGGAAVEPVNGMYVPAELVAQNLHGEAGFVAVEAGTMHQES